MNAIKTGRCNMARYKKIPLPEGWNPKAHFFHNKQNGIYACKLCGKTATGDQELIRHMLVKHHTHLYVYTHGMDYVRLHKEK